VTKAPACGSSKEQTGSPGAVPCIPGVTVATPLLGAFTMPWAAQDRNYTLPMHQLLQAQLYDAPPSPKKTHNQLQEDGEANGHCFLSCISFFLAHQ